MGTKTWVIQPVPLALLIDEFYEQLNKITSPHSLYSTLDAVFLRRSHSQYRAQ